MRVVFGDFVIEVHVYTAHSPTRMFCGNAAIPKGIYLLSDAQYAAQTCRACAI